MNCVCEDTVADIKELIELYVMVTLALSPLTFSHNVASHCFCFIDDDDVPCWVSQFLCVCVCVSSSALDSGSRKH